MYNFGELRRVEIDDKMPCDKHNSFLLPFCLDNNLEELWPALLAKAILKLHSSKFSNSAYNLYSDGSIVYALTGYISQRILANSNLNYSYIKSCLSNKYYYSKQKTIIAVSLNSGCNVNNEESTNIKKKKLNSRRMSYKVTNDGNLNSSNSIISCKKSSDISMINNTTSIKAQNFLSDNDIYNYNNTKNYIVNQTKNKSLDKLYSNYAYMLIDNIDNIDNTNNLSIDKDENNNILKLSLYNDILNLNYNVENIIVSLNNYLVNQSNELKENSTIFVSPEKTRQIRNLSITENNNDKLSQNSFNNKAFTFNFERLIPLDISENKTQHINNINNFRNLSKEKKLEQIKQLEIINKEKKKIKKQKIEELESIGEELCLVKINAIFGEYDLTAGNINTLAKLKEITKCSIGKYNCKDIEMAKKCILNKWKYPPLDYLEEKYNKFKGFDYSANTFNNKNVNNYTCDIKILSNNLNTNIKSDDTKINLSKKLSLVSNKSNLIVKEKKQYNYELYNKPKWTEYYFELVDDFKKYNSNNSDNIIIDVPERVKGSWLRINEFNSIFNSFYILHNTNFFKSRINLNQNYYYYNKDAYDLNLDIDTIAVYNPEFITNNYLNLLSLFEIEEFISDNKKKINNRKSTNKSKANNNTKDNIKYNNKINLDYSCLVKEILLFNNNKQHLINENYFDNNVESYINNCSNNILLNFEPNYRANIDNCLLEYYIVLDFVDNNQNILKSSVILTSNRSSIQIYFNEIQLNKLFYFIVVKGGFFPYGFNLSINSDNDTKIISSYNLYKNIFNYPYYSTNIKSTLIQANKYNLLLKIKIDTSKLFNRSCDDNNTYNNNLNEENVNSNISINQQNILNNSNSFHNDEIFEDNIVKDIQIKISLDLKNNYLKQHINFDLIEENPYIYKKSFNEIPSFLNEKDTNDNINKGNKKEFNISNDSNFNLNKLRSKKIYSNNLINIKLKRSTSVYLVASIVPPYNTVIPEGVFNLFYSNKLINVTNIETANIFEVNGNYKHNKQNYLFKEMLFSPETTFNTLVISAAFDIEDTEKKPRKTNPNTAKSRINITSATTRATKPNSALSYINEDLNKDKMNLKNNRSSLKLSVKIIKDNSILHRFEFYNNRVLSNITIEGKPIKTEKIKGSKTKEEVIIQNNYPLKIECYLEIIGDTYKPFDLDYKINWNIQAYSSGTLSIVQDTSKEDAESNMINNWESNEPGRRIKSAVSRKNYTNTKNEDFNKNTCNVLSKENDLMPIIEYNKKFMKDQVNINTNKNMYQSKLNLKTSKNKADKINNYFNRPSTGFKQSNFIKLYKDYFDNPRTIEYREPKLEGIELLRSLADNNLEFKFEKTVNKNIINKIETIKSSYDLNINKYLFPNLSNINTQKLSYIDSIKSAYKSILTLRDDELRKLSKDSKNDINYNIYQLINSRKLYVSNQILRNESISKLNIIIDSYKYNKNNFDLNWALDLYLQYYKHCSDKDKVNEVNKILSDKKEQITKENILKKRIKDKETAKLCLEEFNKYSLIISNETKCKLLDLINNN